MKEPYYMIWQYMLFSISAFCSLSVFMSVFGDALAWYRMPKFKSIDEAESVVLDDAGFDLIPHNCFRPFGRNIQSWLILLSIIYTTIQCIFVKKNGMAILQRIMNVSCVMMMLRTMTLNVTVLPNPNPLCMDEAIDPIGYFGYGGTVEMVLQTFPAKTCGNLMFSGHTMFIMIFLLSEYTYELVPPNLYFLSITKTIYAIYSIIACRSHYTIDVLLGVIITPMVFFLHRVYFPKQLEIPYDMHATRIISNTMTDSDDSDESDESIV